MASDTIEQAGVERAIRASRSADLQLLLVDPSQGWTNEHQQLLDLNPTKSIIVETKSDLQMTNSHHRGEFKAVQNPHARVSSITGDGIRELLEAISMRLVPQIPPSGQGVLINPIQQQALEDRFGDQVTFR
jgi:tRNA U34 5-carboxymethylaminomethyl modifying GTPase MnmE/TrmE